MTDLKNLQAREKKEVASPTEQTKSGPVFSPEVDIFENEQAIILLADLPGVKAEHLNVDLRENILTIVGDVAPFEGPNEEDIAIEFEVGQFVRQFTLSEVIDQSKIDAKLIDGILRLTLPKVEKAAPRRISIKTEEAR